ncbi:hypothetical protein GS982_20315 [Rhodococcus hoagii]|nr:hypothetical protein [Prescottella equi]NKZ84539.1 hypothetical protein [Prescottella equi]
MAGELTPTSFTSIKAAKDHLLIKALDVAIFLAPHYTPHPSAFTDTGAKLLKLPATFAPVGLIAAKDGVSFARNVETTPTESYGELQATRLDVTADTTTMSFTPQQTTKLNLELANNVDLAAVKAGKDNGEVFFAQSTTPRIRYYSAIAIGRDGDETKPIYIFKVMPKVAVSKYDGESWNKDTLVGSQKLTLTAFNDATAGFAVGHGFGGQGWLDILEDVGFEKALV